MAIWSYDLRPSNNKDIISQTNRFLGAPSSAHTNHLDVNLAQRVSMIWSPTVPMNSDQPILGLEVATQMTWGPEEKLSTDQMASYVPSLAVRRWCHFQGQFLVVNWSKVTKRHLPVLYRFGSLSWLPTQASGMSWILYGILASKNWMVVPSYKDRHGPPFAGCMVRLFSEFLGTTLLMLTLGWEAQEWVWSHFFGQENWKMTLRNTWKRQTKPWKPHEDTTFWSVNDLQLPGTFHWI